MTKTGHNITGFFFGIITGISNYEFLQSNLLSSIAVGYITYKGSNAPDFLEVSWFDKEKLIRKSLIKHRTYTHWTLLWLALMCLSILGLMAVSKLWIYPLAFSLGGLLHLLMDLPNPSGIPVIYPTRKRKSLKWWRSGENELLINMTMGIIALAFIMMTYRENLHEILNNPTKYANVMVKLLINEAKDFIHASTLYFQKIFYSEFK